MQGDIAKGGRCTCTCRFRCGAADIYQMGGQRTGGRVKGSNRGLSQIALRPPSTTRIVEHAEVLPDLHSNSIQFNLLHCTKPM